MDERRTPVADDDGSLRWGEDTHALDYRDVRFDAFRGFIWVFVRIGVWWVAAFEVGWIVVLAVVLLGWHAVGPGLAIFVAGAAATLWIQGSIEDWTADHNARAARRRTAASPHPDDD